MFCFRNLELPVDYFLKILEKVTEICHHCLIEKEIICSSNKSKNDTQRSEAPSIFDSLVHVFSSQSSPNRITATEEGGVLANHVHSIIIFDMI